MENRKFTEGTISYITLLLNWEGGERWPEEKVVTEEPLNDQIQQLQ